MKKKLKIFKILILVITLFIGIICLINMLNKTEISESKILANTNLIEGHPNLINISECSEEFMENYFEGAQKLDELGKKENILIVTSENGDFDSYGASYIVEAPNHKYLLQYSTLEEKNQAFENLKTSNELDVQENLVAQIEELDLAENNINTEQLIVSQTESEFNSWGIEATYLDYAIKETQGKELNDVTVAILDTGCNMELFNQNYPGKIKEFYDVCVPENNETKTMIDTRGHGTHIAGTIAEGTPDNVKILPIRVSTDGYFYLDDILEAINYVVYYEKADILNLSYGRTSWINEEYEAFETANQKNIICVAAAGNKNSSGIHTPSAYDNTLSIASVDSDLNKSSFSNWGSTITFAAPGKNILSINGVKDGTSMATPHAVCAVAILKSYNKNITLENTIELLKDNAVDLGDEGWDKYYGHGLISFGRAQFCEKNGCDGSDCDKFCIFKKEKIAVERITDFEITPVLTGYNYGSINNILMSKIQITYDTGNTQTKNLHQLNNFSITGYDPYASGEQNVTLTYEGIAKTFSVTNYENYTSGWEYIKLDENNIELTGYKDNRLGITKLYLPEKIDGYTVISISEYEISTPTSQKIWGESTDELYFKVVTAPSTFKKIGSAPSHTEEFISEASTIEVGKCAFYENKTLKNFKGTISKLGKYAFYNCEKIKEIELANIISEIPSCAFTGCMKLEKINIPLSINTIGNAAFSNTFIKDINIPEGVTVIEKETFTGCYALTKITLPQTITEIKTSAFSGTNIMELFIPESVVKIESGAFRSMTSLEKIKVADKNAVYDSREDCNAIIETQSNKLILGAGTTIIPASIKVIGEFAFYKNEALNEIVIPEGVEEIESYAFSGCGLKMMMLPRTLNIIGENALELYNKHLLYTNSYAETYAKDNQLTYETINPVLMGVTKNKTEYRSFETVQVQDIDRVVLFYNIAFYDDEGIYQEKIGATGKLEDVTEYAIKYMNDNDSFRYGDTHYTVITENQYGESIEKQIEIKVSKAIPTYIIPENLVAEEGIKLSEIDLPEGFEWIDSDLVTKGEWNEKFYAKYIPEDTNNYEIIESIEIIINKKYKEISNIFINLDKTEYNAFDLINVNDLSIDILYSDNSTEKITSDIEVLYNNGVDLRYGDTFITIKCYTQMKELIEEQVNITVNKIKPFYEIPTELEGKQGQALSEIDLPLGFYWMNNELILENLGEHIYKVKYIPEDTINYEIIENIDIKINVFEIQCTEIVCPIDEIILDKEILISELGIYALPEEAINKELTYEIENTEIAKIENNTIIILKDGTTNLIVKTTDGSEITKTISITVDKPLPFVDIKDTDWCYGAVRFVYKNGYIVGTTETTYEPGLKLTRGMIVTILNRMEGNNKPDVECKFSDVQKGEYYYNSVKWATEAGIVHGYEDGKFRPNKAITREELAVILRNYTRYKGVDTNLTADLSGFNDGDTVSSFAQKSVEWAVARGVITGYTHNNTIAPQGTATRDVAASVIYKYFKTAN